MAPTTKRGTKRTATIPKPSAKKAKLASKPEPVSQSSSDSEQQSDDSQDELDFSSSEDELDNEEEKDELDKDEIKINSDSDNEDQYADAQENHYEENGNEGDYYDQQSQHYYEQQSQPPPEKVSNNKTSSEAHLEQRKLLAERKLQRKSGIQVQHIKSLWERLRVKNPPAPKEVRDKLCEEIWVHSKDVVRDLVLKHDASRVVQTLVKYSSKERREAIVQALKTHYYELATSSYGKYLLVKLLHYGSKDSRELILSELHGKLRKLMRHREGAYVVEDLYVLYSTAEQKKQMIREFWGAEYAVFKDTGKGKDIKEVCDETVEKRTLIAKNLQGTISASVEKGSTGFQILHAAMKEYVQIINDAETREFIELLQDQFAELIHTPEGCEVACTLIAKANAKERKNIVRALREHGVKLAKNEYGNLVLTTLFTTVDDTIMIYRGFLPDFQEHLSEFLTDKYARRPFLYLLNGLDNRFFSPIVKKELNQYIELSKETSKKPQEQRREQLLERLSPLFYKHITENTIQILSENIGSQFITEVFLNNSPIEDDKRQEAITAIIESFKADIEDEESLINKPFSVRLLKSLIQGGKWDAKEKKLIKLDIPGIGSEFAERFYNEVIGDDLSKWVSNKNTSFIIVSIFESIEDKKAPFFKDLKNLKKVVKSAGADENKGAQLLVKLAGF